MASSATSTTAPARRCAYRVCRRVFGQGAYADRALHGESAGLDARDRGLAMRLAFGTIQRRLTLDHLIEQFADRPAPRLDPHVLAALRLGLYELLFLDGAPDRAVVADSVQLAKDARRGGHGLVNAVLRRAATEGADALDALTDDTPENAAVRHSHPRWLARHWFDVLGPEAARALMAADNEPAELALRVNTLTADADAVLDELPAPARRDPVLPEALVVDGPFDTHGSSLWASGAVMAQSRAAMGVARALAPEPGERVLDLCAAPGAKTTHLAALMDGRGEIAAVERHGGRATALRATCARMGAANVTVRVADAGRPVDGGPYDRVLLDPPCSGLGTLQARPDLRWRVTPEGVATLARAQGALLDAAAAAVRPSGGILVYSTCTISPEENERAIEGFLDRHQDFVPDELPGRSFAAAAHVAEGRALTLPHRDGTAGFFVARLRRHGGRGGA